MQADSLKFLAEQGVKAGPRVIELPNEPRGRYGLIREDGHIEVVEPELSYIDNKAFDIDTLCRIANTVAKDPDPKAKGTEVWFSRDRIQVVFSSDEPEGNSCTLDLSPSPQVALLQRWDSSGGVILTQAEFVILLRTMFAGCGSDVDKLLPAVKGVKATKGAEVSQQISQGKVSMSRSVVAEMTGASAIPERVTLWVPMFAQNAVQDHQFIHVEIDPVPDQEKFRLIVLPGDIEKAQADSEDTIHGRIVKALGEGCTIPVYRGKP